MNPVIDGQLPPVPINAWGAFFEHFDREIAEGRETPESVRQILKKSCRDDMNAHLRRCVRTLVIPAVRGWLENLQQSNVPFWAKKWRGQR